ncbi:MAG: NTP transferase domain-containing protein [Dysgonamonadaceae bacterium]|jgi:choline kinase|nr:NTP transferase domain-containing protein [Dysgonamonadaceae bacterium]
MNYAIIAAGEGSRLIQEDINCPKPLVAINGTPLIKRLIAIFSHNNAASISVIVNEKMVEVQEYLRNLQPLYPHIPINILVKSTPSSMHSFYEISRYLPHGKFCLTTVDTIFKEDEFTEFIRAFESDRENDGLMAVTDYIDDEKPLYVSVNKQTSSIDGFLDRTTGKEKYVSGGIYCLTSRAIDTLNACIIQGMEKMRNYQRQLIADGLKLKAYPFGKIIDVDHAGDILKAEEWINGELTNGNIAANHLFARVHTNPPERKRIAGVRRGARYSPNHIGNDAAIFDLTVEHLKKYNYEIKEYSEEEFQENSVDEELVFNMARDTQSIRKLQLLEDSGKIVINSGYGIENCTREKMTRILLANQIPHPRSLIVPTDNFCSGAFHTIGNCYWVKRGDFHAIHREDVTFARNVDEAENIVREYALRGIPSVVLNEHIEGDLVKFYGLRDSGFFYWFYPDSANHSKFGWETINGKAIGIPFSVNELKAYCDRAAVALDVYIYGGDCVIDKKGIIRIIDFNDWPSFAPCRNEAAPHIAECIHKTLTHNNKNIELKLQYNEQPQ